MQPDLSRTAVLEWANGLLRASCQSFSQIPAKGIARIMNAMFGNERCPLHEIHFSDDSAIAVLWNSQKVLELARRCGYDGKLDAARWISNVDYANELIFWRWLRTSSVTNVIPSDYDFSLVPMKQPAIISHGGPADAPATKRLRSETVPVATSCSAPADAAQAQAVLVESISQFKLKEAEVNTSGGCDESAGSSSIARSCPTCPSHIQRVTRYHSDCVRKLEIIRTKIRQACEEKNLEKLLASLEEVI